MTLLKNPLFYLVCVLALLLAWKILAPPPTLEPTLSKQEKQALEKIKTDAATAVARDTAQANRADSAATKARTAGNRAAAKAKQIHANAPAKHAPTPVPTTPAGASELERILTNY